MTYDENSARDKETEMAKIFGFEIKSVKSFKSHDGYPIFQGNVYFKGKKIGSWSQDDWAAPIASISMSPPTRRLCKMSISPRTRSSISYVSMICLSAWTS